eukprot:10776674-Lingulodinium_polyedra.AAC.1
MPMKLISARRLIMLCKKKCHVVSYLVSSWVMSRLAKNERLLTESVDAPLPNRNTGGIGGVGEIANTML